MAGMAPRWLIYCREAEARLKERVGFDPRERELPCDPGVAGNLNAEVFGHGRADDLAHWPSDASAARRHAHRLRLSAGETALLQAVAAAANAGGGGNVTEAAERHVRRARKAVSLLSRGRRRISG